MLEKIATRAPKSLNKESAKLKLAENKFEIQELQHKMNAQGKYSLLVVFQGMDASGKDGTTKRVFSGVNPSGINVISFKKPTEEEYAHDFLWRVHKHAPAKGMIQVFNRSHYEDILVPTVLNLFPSKIIKERYDLINSFEKTLEHNDTKILKFYLHASKEEQEKRLLERINLEEKHWKHNDGDWESRALWNEYQKVYEKIFVKCNHPKWHIIAADQNWYKAYQVSEIVLKTLKSMKLEWPALESEKFKPSK